MKFKSGRERVVNYKLVNGKRIYNCNICKFETEDRGKMYRHVYKYKGKEHEYKKKIINVKDRGYCKVCHIVMKNERDLRYHNITKKHLKNAKKNDKNLKK